MSWNLESDFSRKIMNMYKNLYSLLAVMIVFACSQVKADVTLTDLGSNIVLDNGIVSATIGKSNARLLSIKHKGSELLGNGGVGYLQVVVNKKFSSPSEATFSIIAKDDNLIDVAYSWQVDSLEMVYHYVMTSDDSGIFSYATIEYDPSKAPTAQLEQINYCLRTDKDIFTRLYADDERIFDMPTPEQLEAGKTLSPPEATLLANGEVDHKYRFSKYMKDTDVHGWAGKGKGHWMISPTNEYVNGGPTSQELTVHQTTKTPVTLRMLHAAHYGSGVTNLDAKDGNWRKLYGPWFVYLNEGDNQQVWADAKAQFSKQAKVWPYSWVKDSLNVPAAKRTTVTGKINISDGSNPDGALIVLAQPTDDSPDTNWQRQGKDYIFWAEAEEDGSFKINDVRPGKYTLYASVSGVLDEFVLDGVEVEASSAKKLGNLDWKPKTFGKLIWQIGIPDRTAAEFKHGDDFRQWGLWLEYPKDFPEGVDFTVGKSKEKTDWNYAQWCVQNDKGGYDTSPWKINFNLDEIDGEQAVLTIAIASARGELSVTVNGTKVFENQLIEGGAAHREGIQGFYYEEIIKFDASILNTKSINTIVLEQTKPGLFESIMYDCIRLEIGSKVNHIAN